MEVWPAGSDLTHKTCDTALICCLDLFDTNFFYNSSGERDGKRFGEKMSTICFEYGKAGKFCQRSFSKDLVCSDFTHRRKVR